MVTHKTETNIDMWKTTTYYVDTHNVYPHNNQTGYVDLLVVVFHIIVEKILCGNPQKIMWITTMRALCFSACVVFHIGNYVVTLCGKL